MEYQKKHSEQGQREKAATSRRDQLPMASFGALTTNNAPDDEYNLYNADADDTGEVSARDRHKRSEGIVYSSKWGKLLVNTVVPVAFSIYFIAVIRNLPSSRIKLLMLLLLLGSLTLTIYMSSRWKHIEQVGEYLLIGKGENVVRLHIREILCVERIVDMGFFSYSTEWRRNTIGRISLKRPDANGKESYLFLPKGSWLSEMTWGATEDGLDRLQQAVSDLQTKESIKHLAAPYQRSRSI